MSRIYIAGPMSGIPQFNVPFFHKVAGELRKQFVTDVIINPAELDTPVMQQHALNSPNGDLKDLEEATRETWGEVLARDVKLVADSVDEIVLLPGWEQSRGARLEAFVGLLTEKKFWYYMEGDLVGATHIEVQQGVDTWLT